MTLTKVDLLFDMAGSIKTVLFLGSTREGRMGLRVAKFMKKQLEAANHTVELCGMLCCRLNPLS